MGFPDNLLSDGEEVVMHLHPHWKELVGPVVWFVIMLAIGIVGGSALPDSWGEWVRYGRMVVIAIAVLGIVWLTVIPWTRWVTTHYVFTTHRLLLRTGLISRRGRDIPYARVNDVSFEQTVLQRMFRLGTLIIQSASEHGNITFNDMPRVEMVQSTLYKLVEEDRNRRSAADDPGT